MEAEFSKVEKRIQSNDSENKELKSELAKSGDTIAAFQKELEQCQIELQEVREQNKQLKADQQKTQKNVDKNAGAEKEKLEKEIAKLQKMVEKQNADNQKIVQESQNMKVQLEKAQAEVQAFGVERERFQSQLEMLVQEIERREVSPYKFFVPFYLFRRHPPCCSLVEDMAFYLVIPYAFHIMTFCFTSAILLWLISIFSCDLNYDLLF